MNQLVYGEQSLPLSLTFKFRTVCAWLWDMWHYANLKHERGKIHHDNKPVCFLKLEEKGGKLNIAFVYRDHTKHYIVDGNNITFNGTSDDTTQWAQQA